MTDSRWKDIYNILTENGFTVYSPEQSNVECTSPYVVVSNAGSTGMSRFSSTQELYDIMCYVPEARYSDLNLYVDKVEECLDKLFPMIRPSHFRTSSFHDDSVKAHMISTQYMCYRKNKRR